MDYLIYLIPVAILAWLFLNRPSKADKNEVKSMIEKGSLIVDVRSPGEFATGAYPGAINIPVDQVQSRINEFGDKNRPIVVYCQSGGRSAMAQQMLRSAGYKNVVNGGGLRDMPRH